MKRFSLIIAIIFCLSIVLSACSMTQPSETQISDKPAETQIMPSVTPIVPSATDVTLSPSTELVKQPEFTQRLDLAFGLFSIGIPGGSKVENNRSPMLFQESYEITNPGIEVAANFAPLDAYEETAKIKYDSMVSFYFAILPPTDYTETPYKEETLENGVKLGWQLMKGGARCVIFEAFTEKYGYNFAIYSKDPKVTDETLINMMYSFQYNETVENNIINLKHTKNEDGTFVSVENSLKITLNTEWNEATPLLGPKSVFGLEWNNAETLIELYRYDEVNAEDLLSSFESRIEYIKQSKSSNYPDAEYGEIKTIKLENLSNIDAYILEVDTNGANPIISQNIAFMYEGYCYMGSFMWIKSLDKTKRTEMEAAIHSIAPNV